MDIRDHSAQESSAPQDHTKGPSGGLVVPILAWMVIIGVIIWRAVLPIASSEPPSTESQKQESALVEVMLKMQGKMLLAMESLDSSQGGQSDSESAMLKKQMRDQLETLVTGPVAQRQQVAILAGVLLGSDAIDQMLATLDQQAAEAGVEISPEAARINMALQQAFNSTQHELDASQRELLQSDLGWFGELAIARTQPDQKEAWERIQQGSLWLFAGMMVVFGGGLLLALAGLVGLIIGVIQSFRGRLKPLPQSMGTGSISISIEVFAIWLVLFFLLNLLAGSLGAGLFGAVVAFFVSLVVLFWYPVRGVPLRQAMADNGWTRGRGWIREILAGFAGYAMMLPILAIGLVLTMLLMQLAPKGDDGFASDAGAAHPLFILLSDSTTLNLVLIYLAASVAAPIVEETLFRGVLYRHLRSLSRHWAIWLSIGMSGLVSGFIFAAIHPQGWMGIPVLAAIGFAMALAREWRNSLIAPMVMHALSNGLVMTMAVLLLS